MKRPHPLRSTTLAVCGAGLLSALLSSHLATAQGSPDNVRAGVEDPARRQERWSTSSVDRTYKLKYPESPQDQNELLTALRNMLDPATKIFLSSSTGIVAVRAPEEEQARVVKLLTSLDQPHPRYRLTYTLTELDGGKKIGVQHFSLVAATGQRSILKQGSRIPIQLGSGTGTINNNVAYIDIGMNFEVTLTDIQGGAVLKSKVEQTSTAPDSTSPSNPNPVIRQTDLEGTTSLVLNKPLVIGSLDVPASTRHFDVEVVVEPAN